MPLTEPYSAWFEAVEAALAGVGGPFTAPRSIEYWTENAIDEFAPPERLTQALTRTLPHCLICWPGGGADPQAGGGNSQEEDVDFTIRYAAGAPGGQSADFENALKADGTSYYGAFVVHEWILSKLFALDSVTGFNTPCELMGSSQIRLEKPGVIAMALRWRVKRLRVVHD